MAKIETYTTKSPTAAGDLFVIADSAAANATKKVTRTDVFSDATELPITIGGSVIAKIDSSGFFTNTITELTASAGVIFNGTGNINLNNSGILFGSSVHNNAAPQGASDQQDIRSGTYTPTSSNQSNLAANPTMTKAQWLRVGNVVTVSGRFTADPTLTATSTLFDIDLPVPSTFSGAFDCAGTSFCGNISAMGGAIIAGATTARIFWLSTDITSQSWSYTFTYEVL